MHRPLSSRLIENELQIANDETTDDGLFTLQKVACLGCCSLSPVVMINEETYGRLTPKKVQQLLKEYRGRFAGRDRINNEEREG